MRLLGTAVGCCSVASGVCLVGVAVGTHIAQRTEAAPPAFVDRFARFDGLHYKRILTEGYNYDPAGRSEVAFFPIYPVAAWLVVRATALEPVWSLVLTSNAFLVVASYLLGAYVIGGKPPASFGNRHSAAAATPESAVESAPGGADIRGLQPSHRDRLVEMVLLAFAILPATFFFRMAYSESTLLFFCILSFYGNAARMAAFGRRDHCRHRNRVSPRRGRSLAAVSPLRCAALARRRRLFYSVFNSDSYRDLGDRRVYAVPVL